MAKGAGAGPPWTKQALRSPQPKMPLALTAGRPIAEQSTSRLPVSRRTGTQAADGRHRHPGHDAGTSSPAGIMTHRHHGPPGALQWGSGGAADRARSPKAGCPGKKLLRRVCLAGRAGRAQSPFLRQPQSHVEALQGKRPWLWMGRSGISAQAAAGRRGPPRTSACIFCRPRKARMLLPAEALGRNASGGPP